jgi:subtilisin family serine protease
MKKLGAVVVLLLALALPACELLPPDLPFPIPIPTPVPAEPYDCLAPPDMAGKYFAVENAIEGQIIVVLREGKGIGSQAQEIAGRFKALKDVRHFAELGQFAAGVDDIKTVAAILADPDVLYVSQEQRYSVSPKAGADVEWGLDRIDQRDPPLDEQYNPSSGGVGVDVDIIDTGVSDHPEFGGRLVEPCHTEFAFRGCADGHGHGTHVAGTVGSVRWGVAKSVWLHSVRVLGEDGSGTTSQVIAGINASAAWARESGPRVANMSLGGSADPPLDQAVCDAIEAGVVFAIAAGNDGQDPWGQSPARVLQALTVGAMDINDAGAYFSNKGPGIDIWAPGVDIRSAKPGGGSDSMSGTSMASPHVAGAAAIHLEGNPDATMAEVASAITGAASRNKLGGIGSSPNVLLYVGED